MPYGKGGMIGADARGSAASGWLKRSTVQTLVDRLEEGLGPPTAGEGTYSWTIARSSRFQSGNGEEEGATRPATVVLLRSMEYDRTTPVAAEVIIADPSKGGLAALKTFRIERLDEVEQAAEQILDSL